MKSTIVYGLAFLFVGLFVLAEAPLIAKLILAAFVGVSTGIHLGVIINDRRKQQEMKQGS